MDNVGLSAYVLITALFRLFEIVVVVIAQAFPITSALFICAHIINYLAFVKSRAIRVFT